MSVEQPHSITWRILSQFGLSARLLLLTILFVMIAEVLIYVPSVANFRLTWLNDRLAAARIAAMVLDAAPEESLPEEMEMRLLQGVGARAIALRGGGRRSLLAAGDMPPEVDKSVDLRSVTRVELVRDDVPADGDGGDPVLARAGVRRGRQEREHEHEGRQQRRRPSQDPSQS